jgi:oxygen-independent coproporphyrinogen-3 oxidase
MGVTSIGMVGPTYSQNVRSIEEYYQRLSEGLLPVFRGFKLNRDDLIRRDVITRLICHFALDFAGLQSVWGIRFADYFAEELKRLQDMAEDGLLTLDNTGIRVRPPGRLLIRNVCMVFDAYLDSKQSRNSFSKVI